MSQRERRQNPYPWTWEPAALVVTVLGLVVLVGLQTGRSLANGIAAGSWKVPPVETWAPTAPGLLAGDAAAGLDPEPDLVASSALLWTVTGLVELVLLAITAYAVSWGWRRWNPWRPLGFADPADIDQVLGLHRLRRNAHLIRPDLHVGDTAADESGREASTEAGQAGAAMSTTLSGRRRTERWWRKPASEGRRRGRFDPTQVGWHLGRASTPNTGRALWVPWDRTTGVLGPQGSGKTLDLLVPALLDAPGAALVTTTKPDDLYLTWTHRGRFPLGSSFSGQDRPCVVADPFGLAPHLTPLVWDPIAGCADPWVAHRRAHAFCAGLTTGDSSGGGASDASRFYTAEAVKVTAAFLHAAAHAGQTLDQLLRWVADPIAAVEPVHVLRCHPHAAPQWHGLLHAALHGDERTAANTATTVQQALGLFFQPALRARCTPTPDRPATDLDDLIRQRGTVYLLGRDDPYAPATPLLTAIAEDVLDTALRHAHASPYGRLCPPLLACLDELPSIAPLPTLQTRMANERALGISFIWAAQTYTQLVTRFGNAGAQTLLGLTNVLAVFGGTTDPTLTKQLTELAGRTRTPRTSWNHGRSHGRTTSTDDMPTLTTDEIRLLPPGQALVLADQARPLIARLQRCATGPRGR